MMAEETEKVEALRKQAFDLTPDAQYRLAFFIAENIGHILSDDTADRNETAPISNEEFDRALQQMSEADLYDLHARNRLLYEDACRSDSISDDDFRVVVARYDESLAAYQAASKKTAEPELSVCSQELGGARD